MNSQALPVYSPNGNTELNSNQGLALDNSDLRPAAGLVTLTNSALLDLADMISDRDLAILTELVDAFLSEVTRQVQKMRRGIRENDMSMLFLPAHSLKSSSATFGAMRLAKLSQMLEDVLSDARDKDVLDHFVTEIETEATAVFAAMRNALIEWRP